MSIFTKAKTKFQYRRNMKHLSKQFSESAKLFDKNEKRIQEVKKLIKEDQHKDGN